jgi:hypothetical protein
MDPVTFTQVIDCMGATVRNDELQPVSDPALTLSLKAQDGQIYVLPLSERGAARLWEVLSFWRQAAGSVLEKESPAPTNLQ